MAEDIGRISWWHWIPTLRWRLVGRVGAADEVPARLPRKGVVLVGSLERPKWLVFDCPCLRRHRIMLDLEPKRRAYWRIVTVRALTVWPSVDFQGPSFRCHFFLRKGRAVWVRNQEDTA